MSILLSLVIPTNGVVEWLNPVLNSIYNQDIDEKLFEVIVTDNGNNKEFESFMDDYASKHTNFIYKKTNAKLFLNQIEAFKLANGEFIKFINHRTKLKKGTLRYFLSFVENNLEKKPITFFLNGASKINKKNDSYSFNSYVYNLKNYSSWSGGISCWKTDLEKILNLFNDKNTLFPHTIFCFYYEQNRTYLIENDNIFENINPDETKKGKYNLFYAFCVEYINIILELYDNGLIENRTKDYVLEENKDFVANLFFDYIVLRKPCSYDLKDYKNYINYYYSMIDIYKLQLICFFKRIKTKFKNIRSVRSE